MAYLVAVLMSALGVVGDYWLRIAGSSKPTDMRFLILGIAAYALTALGWFYALQYLKLATVGVIYSLFTIILLTLLGTFYFKEQLNFMEGIGLALAVVSILLLARFA